MYKHSWVKKEANPGKEKYKSKSDARVFHITDRVFAHHQFSADRQLEQLNLLKRCLPDATCLVTHDFRKQ